MILTQQRKIKSFIGFAIKSRNIIFGADLTIKGKNMQYLIMFTDNINRTAKNRLIVHAEKSSIPVIIVEENQMEEYVNKSNCKCITITDKNLAAAIINSFSEGGAANE